MRVHDALSVRLIGLPSDGLDLDLLLSTIYHQSQAAPQRQDEQRACIIRTHI